MPPEGLIYLNQKRYEEKIANAISDDDGISALEELLSTDPSLADLFGSMEAGKIAAKTATNGVGTKIIGEPIPFVGSEFPTYFRRADGSTSVEVDFPQGDATRISFQTDVKNNYFSRRKHQGKCEFQGSAQLTFHLFNGRLTFTFQIDKKLAEGTPLITVARISDNAGHGPFELLIKGTVVAPRIPTTHEPPGPPKVEPEPSRPTWSRF